MGWGSFDDQMPMNPKVVALSDGAFRLWMNILAYCNRNATKGVIPKALVPSCDHRHGWTKKQIDGFVREMLTVQPTYEEALLVEDNAVYRVHDYEAHQQYATKQGDIRAYERERKAKSRAKKSGTVDADVPDNVRDTDAEMSGTSTRSVPVGVPRSVPGLSLARERSRDPEPKPSESTSYSPRASGPHPTGVRAEALRTGYVERFAQAMPGIRAPRATNPGTSEPWLTVARLLTDAQVSTLLDAFFADEEPFTKDRAPTKIESQIVRLLAHGPTVNGKAQGATTTATPKPTNAVEAAWLSAKQAHHDAFVSRAAPEVLYELEQAEERALAALQAYRRGAA